MEKNKIVPVSVVIPCYNSSATLERCFNSVLEQTVSPIEVIFVDDKSTDDSVSIIRKFMESHGFVKLIEQEINAGPGEARNKGWDVAIGKYIAFLDSDDIWLERKLENQYQFMFNNPDANLSAHKSLEVRPWSKVIEHNNKGSDWRRVSKKELLKSNILPTRSVMLKKDLSFRFEDMYFSEDYLLWLNISAVKGGIYFSESVLAHSFFENNPARLSGRYLKMQLGVFHSYSKLYQDGRIGKSAMIFYSLYSLLKLPFRFLIGLCNKIRVIL